MKYLLIIFIFISFLSCKKPVKYSDIPQIEFLNIPVTQTYDTLGNLIKRARLSFYLIDGDGDIGLNQEDTFPPFDINSFYYNNIFVEINKLDNGNYLLLDSPKLAFRSIYIKPLGQNKTLKCTFFINLDFIYPSEYDSLKFDFYIYDRALHKSNIATTGLVVI